MVKDPLNALSRYTCNRCDAKTTYGTLLRQIGRETVDQARRHVELARRLMVEQHERVSRCEAEVRVSPHGCSDPAT